MLKYLTLLFLFCVSTLNSSAQELIEINTQHTSLLFRTKGKRIEQVYYGGRIHNTASFLHFGNAFDIYASYGVGEQNEAALHAVHADGNTSTQLIFEGFTQEEISPNVTLTTLRLKDPNYPFTVQLFYKAYLDCDMIEQWSEYSHNEKKPVTLYRFASAQLSLNADSYYLTHFAGDWANEVNMRQTELTEGIKIIDSKLGTRAHIYAHPMSMLSLGSPLQEESGEVIAMALAWPASFQLAFEKDKESNLRILAGMNPYGSQYNLKRGDRFRTPALLYTFSANGSGQASRNFHSWARRYGIRNGEGERYALMNNWESTYFDFTQEKLEPIIADVAAMDFDLFLLDDGWFGDKHPRNSDRAGLGDWMVNKEKLPNGLGRLIEICHNNNLKFGLWLEPEMVNPESELFEKHPDWAIQQPGRAHTLYRNQLVLDLTNPKVKDFVFNTVDQVLRENPQIAFVKWDCNSPIGNSGSTYLPAQEQSHLTIDYGRALLSIFDQIRTAHPNVQFMLCSGGGGRLDYGSLRSFEEYWPSDNTDALQRIFIQWGNLQFFPPIAMRCLVSACPNHQTYRSVPLKFRFDVAMQGNLGMDLQPATMSPEERAFAKSALQTYRALQPVIFKGDLYQLISPYTGNRAALMYVLPQKDRAVAYVYQLKAHAGERYPAVRFKGLDPLKQYRVTERNLYPGSKSVVAGNEASFSGDYLMKQGLHIQISGDYQSAVLELTAL